MFDTMTVSSGSVAGKTSGQEPRTGRTQSGQALLFEARWSALGTETGSEGRR